MVYIIFLILLIMIIAWSVTIIYKISCIGGFKMIGEKKDNLKKNAIITLSILNVISCSLLNLGEYAMGSATAKNVIVTSLYVAIWIFVLLVVSKRKDRKTIKFYSAFWLITFFSAILTVFANITDVDFSWAIPLMIFSIGEWLGMDVFVRSDLIWSIIISIISLIIFTISIIWLKRTEPR